MNIYWSFMVDSAERFKTRLAYTLESFFAEYGVSKGKATVALNK